MKEKLEALVKAYMSDRGDFRVKLGTMVVAQGLSKDSANDYKNKLVETLTLIGEAIKNG